MARLKLSASDFLTTTISKLNYDYGLSIPTEGDNGKSATDESKCWGQLRYLAFKNQTGAETCLAKFRDKSSEAEFCTIGNLLYLLNAQAKEHQATLGLSKTPNSTGSSFSSTNTASTNSFQHSQQSCYASVHTSFSTSPEQSPPLADGSPFVEVSAPSAPELFGRKPREHHHLSCLPSQGLFIQNERPQCLVQASWRVRYECQRISLSTGIPIESLGENYSQAWEDYKTLWSDIEGTLDDGQKMPPRSDIDAWNLAGRMGGPFENLNLSGTLELQDYKKPALFSLKLNQLSIEQRSSRFKRAFGTHRFLKLSMPEMSKLPDHVNGNHEQFGIRLQEWLMAPAKKFMGYSWDVFHTEYHRPKGKGKKSRYEITLFATSGYGLETLSRGALLDWFLPLSENLKQPYCKAFARVPLGFSNTLQTVVFKPSQIRRSNDTVANGDHEDPSLEDPNFDWEPVRNMDTPRVMNDGCARISLSAARAVWSSLGTSHRPIPSAFQARIGPWKGMWMVDIVTDPESVWIEVTPKQQKFEQHKNDKDDNTFDVNRLTFEVNQWSRKADSSTLYMSYIPILQDRNVPREILKSFCAGQIKKDADEFLDVLTQGRPALRRWMERPEYAWNSQDNGEKIRGALPESISGRVNMLLESGFDLKTSRHLVSLVKSLASSVFQKQSSLLRMKIGKSTTVYAVADPFGCLAPNEIHLCFSKPFSDDENGLSRTILDSQDVLVSRHPALRRSDVQKARAVFKRELQHFHDVAVFSSKGTFPLASKLQGGDYDGDTFWICWDTNLTQSFQNAPPPVHVPEPEEYGITKDTRTIQDVTKGSSSTELFFKECFEFQWKKSYLGMCTDLHEQLVYHTNQISSKSIDVLADLHDYLVDSAKNGYIFEQDAWDKLRTRLHKNEDVSACQKGFKGSLSSPAYKEAEKLPLCESPKAINPDSVADDLVFNVARPEAIRVVKHLENLLEDTFPEDEALSKPYLTRLASPNPDLQAVLSDLRKDLQSLFEFWSRYCTSSKTFPTDLRSKCLGRMQAIQPTHTDNPVVQEWLVRSAPTLPSTWELIKASALYKLYPTRDAFVFAAAGSALCFLKSHSGESAPRSVMPDIHRYFKMRKPDEVDQPSEHQEPISVEASRQSTEDNDASTEYGDYYDYDYDYEHGRDDDEESEFASAVEELDDNDEKDNEFKDPNQILEDKIKGEIDSVPRTFDDDINSLSDDFFDVNINEM